MKGRDLKKDISSKQKMVLHEEKATIRHAKRRNNILKKTSKSFEEFPKIFVMGEKPSNDQCETLPHTFVITKENIFYINKIGEPIKIKLTEAQRQQIYELIPAEQLPATPLSLSEMEQYFEEGNAEKLIDILTNLENEISNREEKEDEKKAKMAMLILGVQGVFNLNTFTAIRGAGFKASKVKEYLAGFPYHSIYESKDEKVIEKIDDFKKALQVSLLSSDEVKERLISGYAVERGGGWGGKRPHCVGLCAIVEANSVGKKYIKLIHCNRGVRSNKYPCCGNTIFSAEYNDASLAAIGKIFGKEARFENKKKFYAHFESQLNAGGFVIKDTQPLRKQKFGNCILANQKGLLAAIVPKPVYKKITSEIRKEQIDYLLSKIFSAIEKKQDLRDCMELAILKSYLAQKTASAYSKNKKSKIELIEFVISKLKDIYINSDNRNKKLIQRIISEHQNIADLFMPTAVVVVKPSSAKRERPVWVESVLWSKVSNSPFFYSLQESKEKNRVKEEKTFYEILGIPETADPKTIATAFKIMSRTQHPDKVPDEKKLEQTEIYKHIVEAYEVLRDPEKRASYDAELREVVRVKKAK